MAHIKQSTINCDRTITIRASRRQRDLIDQAARAVSKSRSAFIREAACREAEEVLLNRTLFHLDPEAFDQFSEMLENPPAPPDALRRLLLT
jgi:uncharacterized protein (DUF1778 family)